MQKIFVIKPDGSVSHQNVFNKIYTGPAPAEGVNTHISVNAGPLGRTLMIIGSAQWDAGDSTATAIYIVRCGFNNNKWALYPVVEKNISPVFQLDISINDNGELILQSPSGVWYVSILSNK